MQRQQLVVEARSSSFYIVVLLLMLCYCRVVFGVEVPRTPFTVHQNRRSVRPQLLLQHACVQAHSSSCAQSLVAPKHVRALLAVLFAGNTRKIFTLLPVGEINMKSRINRCVDDVTCWQLAACGG